MEARTIVWVRIQYFFCLLWHERTANKIGSIGKTKANNKCVQFVTNRFWPKNLRKYQNDNVDALKWNSVFKLLLKNIPFTPNTCQTAWIPIVRTKFGVHWTITHTHRERSTRKNPSKRMKQIDTFRMLRVKIESFYHLTICNSIHFSSFLSAHLSSLQFRMMGWLFMQRIHMWKWLHVCETRWLNMRSFIRSLCNLLLVVTNDSCLRLRNQRSWFEFPLMHIVSHTDCNLNSMPWRAHMLFSSLFFPLNAKRPHTHARSNHQKHTCMRAEAGRKVKRSHLGKRGNNKSYYRFIGLIKCRVALLFFLLRFCHTDCWLFLESQQHATAWCNQIACRKSHYYHVPIVSHHFAPCLQMKCSIIFTFFFLLFLFPSGVCMCVSVKILNSIVPNETQTFIAQIRFVTG